MKTQTTIELCKALVCPLRKHEDSSSSPPRDPPSLPVTRCEQSQNFVTVILCSSVKMETMPLESQVWLLVWGSEFTVVWRR